MQIFLSWSGDRSKRVANALRTWLPLVLHYVDPWLSEKDIDAGERWSLEIGKRLEESNFGIICLTRENLDAPWILFEAGALSKALHNAHVCPYLFDLDFKDLTGPLAQFHAKKADQNQTRELVATINSKAAEPVEPARLAELFEALWPKLEDAFRGVPSSAVDEEHEPQQRDVIEDLVGTVRSLDHRFRRFEESLLLAVDASQVGGGVDSSAPPVHRVDFDIDEDLETSAPHREFTIEAPAGLIIHSVAMVAGLSPSHLDKKWFLRDRHTGRTLSRNELGRYLSGTTDPALTITSIPF